MELFRHEGSFGFRQAILLIFLVFVPNLLAMLNIPVKYGFMLHFFQIAIFTAAFMYGPMGGLLAGMCGSVYSGIVMSNPYLVVGNGILGFAFGYLAMKGMSWIKCVSIAFLIQLPWLIATDYFLIGMPMAVLGMLIFSLAVADIFWAYAASFLAGRLKHYV